MDVRDAHRGRQDHSHHLDRRHGAERSLARDRQAQLRAPGQLRGDRAQARQRALRADHQVRARGQHRPPRAVTWRSPGTISMREETFRARAHRHRRTASRCTASRTSSSSATAAVIRPGSGGRRFSSPSSLEGQAGRRAHPGVLRLRRGRRATWRSTGRRGRRERQPARRSDHHAQHVRDRSRARSLVAPRWRRACPRSTAFRMADPARKLKWPRRSWPSAPTTRSRASSARSRTAEPPGPGRDGGAGGGGGGGGRAGGAAPAAGRAGGPGGLEAQGSNEIN